MDLFEKLFEKAGDWNKMNRLQSIFTPPNFVFNDYFLIYGNNLEHDFNKIMNLWLKSQYVPNNEVIESLCSFLKKYHFYKLLF
jgi:hypothetical protein